RFGFTSPRLAGARHPSPRAERGKRTWMDEDSCSDTYMFFGAHVALPPLATSDSTTLRIGYHRQPLTLLLFGLDITGSHRLFHSSDWISPAATDSSTLRIGYHRQPPTLSPLSVFGEGPGVRSGPVRSYAMTASKSALFTINGAKNCFHLS